MKLVTLPRENIVMAIRYLEKLEGLPEKNQQGIEWVINLLKKDTKPYSLNVSPSVRQSVLTLDEAIQNVQEQIDIETFRRGSAGLAVELCRIIAEVLIMPTTGEDGKAKTIKIKGEYKPVSVVQSVFYKLRYEHIELVIDNFQNITEKIYNKHAYLLTTLYVSWLECDAHYTNQYKHDLYNR